MRLKMRGSHLTWKAASKCLDVRELVKVAERNKDRPLFSLLSCESSLLVKENPDRKKASFSVIMPSTRFFRLFWGSCKHVLQTTPENKFT